jgi:hypothetical protein
MVNTQIEAITLSSPSCCRIRLSGSILRIATRQATNIAAHNATLSRFFASPFSGHSFFHPVLLCYQPSSSAIVATPSSRENAKPKERPVAVQKTAKHVESQSTSKISNRR